MCFSVLTRKSFRGSPRPSYSTSSLKFNLILRREGGGGSRRSKMLVQILQTRILSFESTRYVECTLKGAFRLMRWHFLFLFMREEYGLSSGWIEGTVLDCNSSASQRSVSHSAYCQLTCSLKTSPLWVVFQLLARPVASDLYLDWGFPCLSTTEQ